MSKAKLMTSEEVAEFLGVSIWTVRNMCKDGRLKAEKVSTGTGAHEPFRWEIDRASVRRLKERRVTTEQGEGPGTNLYVSRPDEWRIVIQNVLKPEERVKALEAAAAKKVGAKNLAELFELQEQAERRTLA